MTKLRTLGQLRHRSVASVMPASKMIAKKFSLEKSIALDFSGLTFNNRCSV